MLSKNKVKYIQTLYHKKQRWEEGLFVVEGEKTVNAILQQKTVRIHSLYALPSWVTVHQHLITSIDLTIINETELQNISNLVTPNEVLAVLHIPEYTALPNANEQLVLVLDGIQDPGNMGTIIRTADWFGINNIVCSNDTADCYNPKVVQSTMASIANVAVHYTNAVAYVAQYANVPCYYTLLQGTPIAQVAKITNGIVVVGNEGNGISTNLLSLPHSAITIQGKGQTESLNAGVATGIVLSYLVL